MAGALDKCSALVKTQGPRFYGPTPSTALMLRRNRYVVEPPTMALVTSHRRRHYPIIQDSN